MSYSANIWVWAILIVLTFVTVKVAEFNLQNLTVAVALLLASVKATIVAMYFMHLKFESKLFVVMVLFTLLIFGSFILLTFIDYWTR